MRKKDAERNRQKSEKDSNLVRSGRDFGPAGEGFREGVGWLSIWLLAVLCNLARPAPSGCGGSFWVQNSDMGCPGST